MLKLLLYGYTTGVRSSRAIEKRCTEGVELRFLAANQQPDFRSVARFRKRHREALDDLFLQTLMLCVEAGMVSLDVVALDCSKVRANASRRKAGSYGRMAETEQRLTDEVADMMADAEAADAADDAHYGPDGRHEDLAGEMARRETRLAKIRRAKADLEDDARRNAAADAARKAWHRGRTNKPDPDGDGPGTEPAPDPSGHDSGGGLSPNSPDGTGGQAPTDDGGLGREERVHTAANDAADAATPEAKAQRNFTDPDRQDDETSEGSFH